MEIDALKILATVSTGLLALIGTVLGLRYKKESDDASNQVSQFDVLTQRMNDHADRVVAHLEQYRAELEQCKADCAKCHEEHEETRADFRRLRARVRELEREKSGD